MFDTIKFLLIYRHLQNTYWFKRGNLLSLVPLVEALASPCCRNEQRRSPRRYVYKRLWLHRSQWWLSANHKSDTTYPWTSLLLWCLTTVLELPDSYKSSSKRQELAFTRLSFTRTPFLYIGSRPAASTLGLRHSCVPMAASQQSRSGSENDAKIQNF